jgi:hypothetical protein
VQPESAVASLYNRADPCRCPQPLAQMEIPAWQSASEVFVRGCAILQWRLPVRRTHRFASLWSNTDGGGPSKLTYIRDCMPVNSVADEAVPSPVAGPSGAYDGAAMPIDLVLTRG